MTEGNDENQGIEGLPPLRVLTSDDRIERGVEPEGIQGALPPEISNHPNLPRLISTTVDSSSLPDGAGFSPNYTCRGSTSLPHGAGSSAHQKGKWRTTMISDSPYQERTRVA